MLGEPICSISSHEIRIKIAKISDSSGYSAVRTREKNNLELLPGKSKPKSEVYALGMEQRSKIDRFAHRKDVPIKPKKEVYAKGMEQRSSVAQRMDVPIKLKKEVYVSNMEQR